MNTRDKYEILISSCERTIAQKKMEIEGMEITLHALEEALKAAEESGAICENEKEAGGSNYALC